MPDFAATEVDDCHAICAAGGLHLLEWQDAVLEGWLGTDRFGRWTAPTCAGSIPRQNGKTLGLVVPRAIYGMVMLGEEVIYTSHLQKTSTETFESIASFFDQKALRKYVWLKSGGSLVIEATEAMTVVDVNTGKFTGKRNLEDTLFKINCEAAEELVRQLRLRAVGGIIIVDFIDMERPEHGAALVELLQSLAKADKGRLKVVGMTGLGLVELTRKRQRRPLSRQLLHICSACQFIGRASCSGCEWVFYGIHNAFLK